MNLNNDIVHDFLDKCYDSGIKDPVRFLIDKMPRLYGFLKGAFPRGILPTDIDGEVEINGYFLRIEFKHENALREGRIPKGQLKCFDSLRKTGLFTVFLAGHNSAGLITCLNIYTKTKFLSIDPCDNDRFKLACTNWACKVDKKFKESIKSN